MRTCVAYAVFDDAHVSSMTLCRLMRRLQSNADATRFRVGRFLGLGYRTFLTQLSHAGATRPCVCVCVCRAAVGLHVAPACVYLSPFSAVDPYPIPYVPFWLY